MQLKKLQPYNNYEKDLFFWVKYYIIDRILTLDKSEAKDDLDISALTHRINKKVSNIDELMVVCNNAHNLGVKGMKAYSSKLEKLYKYLATLDYESITNITDRTIRDYALKEYHGESEATKTSLYKYAKYFFNFMQEYNIMEGTDKPFIFNIGKDKQGKNVPLLRTHKEKKVIPYFNAKELKTLDEHILTYPNYKNEAEKARTILIMRFFIYSGISVNELLELKSSDIIMLDDKDKNTTFEIEVGKDKKRRVIPLPKKRFIRYLNTHKELSNCNDMLFCSRNGATKIARQTVSKIVKEQLEYAGLKSDVPIEIFKNSFAIFYYESGISDKKIQNLLGHQSIQNTRKILNARKTVGKKIEIADVFKDF